MNKDADVMCFYHSMLDLPVMSHRLRSNPRTLCAPGPDDTVSAGSNMDMEDRVSHLEQKLQLQEDEIQLLKAALADALRRLGCCEEQSLGGQRVGVRAAGRRPPATAPSAPATKGKQGDRPIERPLPR